jgi:hypothetical protein
MPSPGVSAVLAAFDDNMPRYVQRYNSSATSVSVASAFEDEMMTQRPRVAIVGGGIGGLFAANALLAHDIPAAVYEQAPAIWEVGAGVFLTPNSVRHLQRVGLGPEVEESGARVE